MAKLRPILFSTPTVQAILEGRKTQTRRIFKDHPRIASDTSKIDLKQWLKDHEALMFSYSQHGKPGDLLWVREKWQLTTPFGPEDYYFGYADGSHSDSQASEKYDYKTPYEWKPNIHFPFEAARIFLRIKSLRIERLHDLSDADAIAEGMENLTGGKYGYLCTLCDKVTKQPVLGTAYTAFRYLWEDLNGHESWKTNSWVWVIEFERITKEEALKVKEASHA